VFGLCLFSYCFLFGVVGAYVLKEKIPYPISLVVCHAMIIADGSFTVL
jgi:hypothetical protein